MIRAGNGLLVKFDMVNIPVLNLVHFFIMIINLTKQWIALMVVVCLALISPGMTTASANDFLSSPQLMMTLPSEYIQNNLNFSENDLTPQERQKLQSVRQSRNREIISVLDSQQRKQLSSYLHSGNNFHQSIEALDLNPEQSDLISAVMNFSNLKLQTIFDNHALLDAHN
jgi:hypothetical protein